MRLVAVDLRPKAVQNPSLFQNGRRFQAVDKPYEEVPEGYHDPLTGFVLTGYAGRAGWFRPKSKSFLSFFTAVSFADSEKCKPDKVARPLCRHAEGRKEKLSFLPCALQTVIAPRCTARKSSLFSPSARQIARILQCVRHAKPGCRRIAEAVTPPVCGSQSPA